MRKVAALTGIISTVAGVDPAGPGNGNCGFNGDGITAVTAELNEPTDIAIDSNGNLFIADFANYRVREVAATTGLISTIAGNGTRGDAGTDGDGGAATAATLWGPIGVAAASSGDVFIADQASNRIRKVSAANGLISTVAGTGIAGYNGDDMVATTAELSDPQSVNVDAGGNLYIADTANNRIRFVASSSGMISTVAGGGTGCPQQTDNVGDGCSASNATLRSPGSVRTDSLGNLYIADSANERIRFVGSLENPNLILTTSATPSLYGGPVTFTATLSSALTGTVTFYDGSVTLGTATLNGNGAALTVNSLAGGTHLIKATYNSMVSNIVTQVVNRAAPSLMWATPSPIYYGTPLTSLQLNASAQISGMFVYSPASGTIAPLGADTLSVTFTPTDTTDYTTTTATVTLIVNQATPGITWPNVADISYGTPLGSAQLNATSNIPGTFVYSPAAGTVLSVGPHTLTATFTPNDTTDYGNITATTYITVTDGMSKWDAGSVALIVNGSTVSTATYGQSSTPASIAAALASNLSAGSPVNVTDVDDALYLEAKTPGVASNSITYSLQNASYDSTDFSQPSFPSSPESGSLEGGANQGATSGAPVYSYQVPSNGYDGVGNLRGVVDSVMGTWTFSYDALNRLAGATDNQQGNPSTNYCWGYDLFGNRTIQAGSSAAFQTTSPSCTPASGASLVSTWANFNPKNQITGTTQAPGGLTYDAAGGVVNDGVNQYLYDGEGRICAVANGSALTGYIYDADGQRVAKGTISAWSCDPSVNGFQSTNDYILGQSGEQVTEMAMDANKTMAWQHTNVYAAGKLLATYDNNGLHFYLNDPLGTRRAQTDYAGVLEQTCSSLPFGDGLSCTNSTQYPTEHHFTGKERDAESGNDYFGARYYASAMGRWMSPDPSMESEILEVPQTWNRYGYVYNRPLYGTDPDGRCPPCVGALIGGVVGGAVGGIAEGGWSAASQYIHNGSVDWKEVGADAAGGAVSGAITGAVTGGTGGLSLFAEAGVSAGANAAGGEVTRLIEGKDTSASDVIEDAAAGYAGGTIGHIAADLVHVPPEPKPPNNLKSYLKMKKYKTKLLQRNVANGVRTGAGTAAGTPPAHTVSRFFGLLDLFGNPPPPPPPPPQGRGTGTIVSCQTMDGQPCL